MNLIHSNLVIRLRSRSQRSPFLKTNPLWEYQSILQIFSRWRNSWKISALDYSSKTDLTMILSLTNSLSASGKLEILTSSYYYQILSSPKVVINLVRNCPNITTLSLFGYEVRRIKEKYSQPDFNGKFLLGSLWHCAPLYQWTPSWEWHGRCCGEENKSWAAIARAPHFARQVKCSSDIFRIYLYPLISLKELCNWGWREGPPAIFTTASDTQVSW